MLLVAYIVSVSGDNQGAKMESDVKVFMTAILLFIAMLLLLISTSLLADSRSPCSMVTDECRSGIPANTKGNIAAVPEPCT